VARSGLEVGYRSRIEQIPGPSQFDPGEHVTKSVAHIMGEGGVEAMLGRGSEEEAGKRLAAVAAGVRCVRAVPRAVDARPCFGEKFDEAVVGRAIVGLAVETPSDAGLVGDDDDREASVVQSSDCRRGALGQSDVIGGAEIAGVLDDRAVPVEEDPGTGGRGRDDVTPR